MPATAEDVLLVSNQLRRHENRRRQGIPTLTVLTGPVTQCESIWIDWATSLHRRPNIVLDSLQAAIAFWSRQLVGDENFISLMFAFFAQQLGGDAKSLQADIQNKSPNEKVAVFALCEEVAPPSVATFFQWFVQDRQDPANVCDADLLLEAVLHLYPADRTPTLLIRLSNPAFPGIESDLQPLLLTLNRHPWLACAIALSAEDLSGCVQTLGSSHISAILREGAIPIEPETRRENKNEMAAPARIVNKHAGRNPANVPTETDREGTTRDPRLAERISAVQRAEELDRQPPKTQEKSDRARSEAERLLFLLLESDPRSAGLFQLNCTPGFQFGNRPAELDLACNSLKIAIEVDGYYHFTSPDCYRRDRRKDVVMQRHGYLVHRFLAEDVAADPNTILDAVVSTVLFRQQFLDSQKGPV